MDDSKSIEIFLSFLKERHCLNSYFKNVSKYKDDSYGIKNLKEDFNRREDEVINWNMCWCETPEGQRFWNKVDSEWRSVCNESIYRV